MSDTPNQLLIQRPGRLQKMQKTKKATKFTFKIFGIGFLFMLCSAFISIFILSQFEHLGKLKAFLSDYGSFFLLWRLCLMAAIIYAYPKYIERLMRKSTLEQSLTEEEQQSKAWLKSRWVIFGLLVVLEVVINFNHLIQFF